MFLLPFAGGNANSFNKLLPLLDPRIEAVTIEYAGRETRRREGYINNYEAFLSDVADQISMRRSPEKDYALFGYSLGSALAYDLLARKLIEGVADHVFLCSMGGLVDRSEEADEEYSEEDFLSDIISLGGMDERILDNKRFLNIFMEPVKEDFKVWGSFTFKPGKIPCNVTAIYCRNDPAAEGVHEWSDLSTGVVDYYEMGENHFFIHKKYQEVAEIVNSHLTAYL